MRLISGNPSKATKAVATLFLLLIVVVVAVSWWAGHKQVTTNGATLIAVSGDNDIWVAINHNLFILDQSGSVKNRVASADLGIQPPLATLTAYRDGSMLVGSRQTGLLHEIRPDGSGGVVIDPARSGRGRIFGAFHAVYDEPSAEIIVTDTSNHRVLVLDEQGNVLREAYADEDSAGSFRFPNGVALNDDRILVMDTNHHAIRFLNKELETLRQLVVAYRAAPLYKWPTAISLDRSGGIYLSILANGMELGEVIKVDDTGSRTRTFPLAEDAQPVDILVRDEDILITDEGSFVIHRFGLGGEQLGVFGDYQVQTELARIRELQELYPNLKNWGLLSLLVPLVVLVGVQARQNRGRLPRSDQIPRTAAAATTPWRRRFELWWVLGWAQVFPLLTIGSSIQLLFLAISPAIVNWPGVLGIFVGCWIVFGTLSFIAYRLYVQRLNKGVYQSWWQRRAERFLRRSMGRLDSPVSPPEVIEYIAAGFVGRASVLLILTSTRVVCVTASLFGTKIIAARAIGRSEVQQVKILTTTKQRWRWLLGQIPVTQVAITLSSRQTSTLSIFDPGAARELVTRLRSATATVTHPQGVVDLKLKRRPAIQEHGPFDLVYAPRINTWVSMLLSALLPGLGQLYQRRLAFGVFHLLFWFSYFLIALGPVAALLRRTREVDSQMAIALVTMCVLIWLISIVDAYVYARLTRNA